VAEELIDLLIRGAVHVLNDEAAEVNLRHPLLEFVRAEIQKYILQRTSRALNNALDPTNHV
jgi:hypothetical protein